MSIYISTLSLTATAVDRYWSIAVTRLPSSTTNRYKILSTAGVIIAINMTATLAILPYSAHIHWQVRDNRNFKKSVKLNFEIEFTEDNLLNSDKVQISFINKEREGN